MAAIGSMQWALRTGGRVGKFDRLRLMGLAAQTQLAQAIARRFPQDARAIRRLSCIDINAIEIPANASARDALDVCREASDPYLLNHCVRTYLFGAILGQQSTQRYDPELLYTASLLHDMGLTSRARPPMSAPSHGQTCICFALQGARIARQWALDQAWPPSRADTLADAICLHINPAVSVARGVEAHLLQAGAGLDLIGARHREIAREVRDTVFAAWPRLDLSSAITEQLQAQRSASPESRMAWLVDKGFARWSARWRG